MNLSAQSHSSILNTLKKALGKYQSDAVGHIVTDFHLQPLSDTGELVVYNDDEEVLARSVVADWVGCVAEDFYVSIEHVLKRMLEQLRKEGVIDRTTSIMKPYSFVLIDDDKETIAELLLMDDDTMMVSDELLKGLDEELDAFLKDLLEK